MREGSFLEAAAAEPGMSESDTTKQGVLSECKIRLTLC